MNSQKLSTKRNNIIPVIILILLLGGIAIFAMTNRSKNSLDTEKSGLNNDVAETNINQPDNSINENDISNLKIYLSIADNPDDKVIRKTYSGITTVRPDIIVENPPQVSGSCSLEFFRIEGVTSFMADAVTFDVDRYSSRINKDLMLGNYMYRVDLDCLFGDKSYSKVYTLDIKLANQERLPSSYSI